MLESISRRTIGSKKVFSLLQRLGYHITPNHFYYPIPDTRKLKDSLWSQQSELAGIGINDETQLELLSVFEASFKDEYDQFPRGKTDIPHQFFLGNLSLESVDAEVLYCMIRHFKPRRICEIGSGCSTYLSAQAVLKNREEDSRHDCELVAIEPYPGETLKAGFPGLSRLVHQEVQDVPLSEFAKLEENDILFIDSSHVLRIGGDVQYEYLEILPRLNRGVLVHSHDIFLPAEYPKKWVKERHRFWSEQYLLQAFLAFNDSFEVLWAGSYMHLNHPSELEEAFGSYDRAKTLPGSFWVRRVR